MTGQTRKIVLDTVFLLGGKATGLFLGLIRLNYLARYLGLAGFGILNFATFFAALFQFVFDLGLPQIVTRTIARDPHRSQQIVGSAIVLKAPVVVIATLLVVLTSLLTGIDSQTATAIAVAGLLQAVGSTASILLAAFQAHRRMTVVAIYNILNDVLVSLVLIGVVPIVPSPAGVLAVMLLISLVTFVLSLLYYRRTVGPPLYHLVRDDARQYIREGFPLALSALGISVYTFIAPTILRYVRNDVDVGIFSAGYKPVVILSALPMSFSQVVYPIFASFFQDSAARLNKALQDSLRVMFEVSMPLAVGTVVLAPKIVGLLYPESYAEAATVLRLLIAGSSVGYLAWILYTFLVAVDRQRFCMAVSLGTATAVVVLALVLVPRFGFTGVAITSMVVDIGLFCTYAFHARRSGFLLPQASVFARIVAASLLMGGVLYSLGPLPIGVAIPLGTTLYAIAIFAMRVFGDQERALLTIMFRRLFNA